MFRSPKRHTALTTRSKRRSKRLGRDPVHRVRSLKKEVSVKVRRFDEAADERAVTAYCTKRIKDAAAAQRVIETFRAMRKEVAPRQGETQKTWVQAVSIGDVALVGVPGEFFTMLGQEIKRRSPFRYTYVFELANDYVGYIPDEVGFDRGGYQVWTGLHSFLERGSGELSSTKRWRCWIACIRNLRANQSRDRECRLTVWSARAAIEDFASRRTTLGGGMNRRPSIVSPTLDRRRTWTQFAWTRSQ